MLTVTTAALAAIKDHLCQHSLDFAVRITMMGGCCIGENLRFTVGEIQPNDLRFIFADLTFLIDRDLSAQCGAIQIDFVEKYDHCPCSGRNGGFIISSERFSFRCGGTCDCEQWSADCATSCVDACAKKE